MNPDNNCCCRSNVGGRWNNARSHVGTDDLLLYLQACASDNGLKGSHSRRVLNSCPIPSPPALLLLVLLVLFLTIDYV
eukprot:scaffold19713_cov67-Cylindrotheca_fusiformis.AAC.1